MKKLSIVCIMFILASVCQAQQAVSIDKGYGLFPYKVWVSSWAAATPTATTYTKARAVYKDNQDITWAIATDIMINNVSDGNTVYISTADNQSSNSWYTGAIKAGETVTVQGDIRSAEIHAQTLQNSSNYTTLYMWLTGKRR